MNIIGYIGFSCSKSTTSLQPGSFRGSVRHGCCWRRSTLLVFLFVQHNGGFNWSLHRWFVKWCWRKWGVYAWSEHCVHVQLWVFPGELYVFEIGQFIAASVHVLSPTLEITSSLISCFPRWLGVTGTHARWLFKNCCFWDNSICQAAKGISNCFFWTRSFTAVVKKSGPKSRIRRSRLRRS